MNQFYTAFCKKVLTNAALVGTIFIMSIFTVSARTFTVNSLGTTNNYGLLSGGGYWAGGYFYYSDLDPATHEMTFQWALRLTSMDHTCTNPGNENANYCGADTILFDIQPQFAGGQTVGPYIIEMPQGLQIYDQLFIDGFSQPGSSIGNPMIYLNGTDNDGIQISNNATFGDASGSHVQGLGFYNTNSFAVYISGCNDVQINDCYIGESPSGPVAGATQDKGFTIVDGCQNIRILDNVVSGSILNALEISGGTLQGYGVTRPASDIVVRGNYFGTDITGTVTGGVRDNGGTGIHIANADVSVGPIIIEDNLIVNCGTRMVYDTQAGNSGIELYNVIGATVRNNNIGELYDGTPAGNGHDGIKIHGNATHPSSIVAGSHDITVQDNVISHNALVGVLIEGTTATTDIIVGIDETDAGIINTITNNGSHGIQVNGPSHYNVFRQNVIYCNDAPDNRQINIYENGGNDSYAGPTGPQIDIGASDATTLVGTAPAGAIIDVYASRSVAQGGCSSCPAVSPGYSQSEGERWIGQTVATGGTWTFNITGVTGTMSVTATEPVGTHSTSNTSEFSTCFENGPLPVEFLFVKAQKRNNNSNLVTWATISEANNDYFVVEYSADGINFSPIGEVDGAGNSTVLNNYSFIHYGPEHGINYYRIRQVDLDGNYAHSNIASVDNGAITINVYPNPATDQITIFASGDAAAYTVNIYEVTGKLIKRNAGLQHNVTVSLSLADFADGVYLLEYSSGNTREVIRFVKE